MVLKTLKASKPKATLDDSQGRVNLFMMRASILLTLSTGTLVRGRNGTRPGAPKGVTIPFTVVPDTNPPGNDAPTTRIRPPSCVDAAVSMSDSCHPFTSVFAI